MDLVAVDVPGHGNVMSEVIFKGIGIVHRQDLLIFVGNDNRAGASCDALLRACFRARVGSLAPHLESLTQPFTVWASLANDTEATNTIKAPANNNERNFRMSSSSDWFPHVMRSLNFITGGAQSGPRRIWNCCCVRRATRRAIICRSWRGRWVASAEDRVRQVQILQVERSEAARELPSRWRRDRT